MTMPTRPVLRYHGGKWRLAPWIISFFPAHRTYVEPFGGGAGVMLRKAPSRADVYNDLDMRIVGLFRVLRTPEQSAELHRRLELTPYAREEFEASYEPTDDPIEAARRTIVRSMMGHGSRGATSAHRTGFRSARRRGFHAATDWTRYVDALPAIVHRLRSVLIEQRPASTLIESYDDTDTLFYVDPPYPASTRTTCITTGARAYAFELTDDDHRALGRQLHDLRGMVVLSGYACDLYDVELYPTWERHERAVLSDGGEDRTEVVWLNPACSAALHRDREQRPFDFSEAAHG